MLTSEVIFLAGWNFLVRGAYGWQYKILLAPPLVFYHRVLGGDRHVLIAFYVAFLADLIVGVCSAIKRRAWSRSRLELWVVKLLVYSVCIFFVGLVDLSLVRALRGLHLPLLDIIVAVMLANEVVSIFANLHELTGKVPPFLMRAAEKMRHQASDRLEKMLDGEGTEGKK